MHLPKTIPVEASKEDPYSYKNMIADIVENLPETRIREEDLYDVFTEDILIRDTEISAEEYSDLAVQTCLTIEAIMDGTEDELEELFKEQWGSSYYQLKPFKSATWRDDYLILEKEK